MATYVYKCDNCGEIDEFQFPMGQAIDYIPDSSVCGDGMRRVYLPTAVSFKGSGFYKTDNRKTKHVRASAKVGGT